MFLVASGNVDADSLIEDTLRATESWPKSEAARRLSKPKFHFGETVIQRNDTHQHYGIRVWPGYDCNDPRRYALRLLCSILADDSGSRMFWELIDTGRAETATIWPQMFDECGCLLGYLCCAPEDAEENQATMEKLIADLLLHGVTEHELELARNKITASLILSDERPSNRMFALGQSWLSRRSYESLDVVLSRYASVTCNDILDVARQTLSGSFAQVQVVDAASE